MLEKNPFPLPTISSSPIVYTVVVHLPGQQEVVDLSPTGRADFFLSLVFTFIPFLLTYAFITILLTYLDT